MKVVIQRVSKASVTVDHSKIAEIDKGLLALAGFEAADTEDDLSWTASKIVNLRIFDDPEGVMNNSLLQENGEILLVSQFTLHASTQKGNRPSYIKAARPEIAIPLYERFISILGKLCTRPVKTGKFGADMKVELVNDGPVTILIDSRNKE